MKHNFALFFFLFFSTIVFSQSSGIRRIAYDVEETISYKLPKGIDISTISPLVLNRIRKRKIVKSVIQEIGADGEFRVKMRIHSTENLDEPWMDPIKEFYIDEDGTYSVTKSNFVDYPWDISIPPGKEDKPATFRAHSSESLLQHQTLKSKMENGRAITPFPNDLGSLLEAQGLSVTHVNSTDGEFILSNEDKSVKMRYSPSKLLIATSVKVDNGTKITNIQYTTNSEGQIVPLKTTEVTPVTFTSGPCLDMVKTKSYSNYSIAFIGGGHGRASNEEEVVGKAFQGEKRKAERNTPSIFPNPATDNVTIVIPKNYSNPQIEVYTIDGKSKNIKLLRRSNSFMKFSTEDFTPGVYLIHLRNEHESLTYKLFIR